LALAVGVVVFGAKMAHHDPIGTEIAKAGMQLAIVTIIGGSITWILRHVERLREEHRSLNEYRLNVLQEVTTSYNQIKAVRRTLRAFGFTAPNTPLTHDQVMEFRAQMKS
jgi:hypothetical protein